ncbi:hypothetical protein GCM10009715_15770 [Paeniglutamicibacter psychrophenolicus]|uniref:Heme-degrading monooxygenase HmoA n=1 Tax=Paeniglutamicibacter psychrophenolicus TaxID=257454 RepID=A0ABS4WC83_9MICC|nr:hypothetical protein [Paeniglutamicibacter psychrophenolicus]MBP2373820.1 heme-degrading monooxygenase HmoA [Paeniglutamicibacter psychrophenolicus]
MEQRPAGRANTMWTGGGAVPQIHVLTMRIEVAPEEARAFERRFIDHLCTTFTEVPGLASAELEYPRGEETRHAVVLEFDSERAAGVFGDSEVSATVFSGGSWEQDGAWIP